MGSQFAPDDFTIVDNGNAPTFYIDGLAYLCEGHGITRLGFCAAEPVHARGCNFSPYRAMVHVLRVHLVMATPVHRSIVHQVRAATEQPDQALRLALS